MVRFLCVYSILQPALLMMSFMWCLLPTQILSLFLTITLQEYWQQKNSPSYTVFPLRKAWRNSNFAWGGNENTYHTIEMQTPKHWYLIGRSMSTSVPVLSAHSILPRSVVSLRFHSLKGKTDAPIKNVFFRLFNLKKNRVWNCLNANFWSRGVYVQALWMYRLFMVNP